MKQARDMLAGLLSLRSTGSIMKTDSCNPDKRQEHCAKMICEI